ncbi:type II toxin-antitoxin system HipA family toxin [Paraneptunicella aestuarii]|uniref:type II toxin-antitoxin system HipA family toxin n=1 Tax=Paraneptunicella aestuarii TaxID=2831148 RepID=UPI001E5DB54A|nr:type II toxin-antitoxin system HipA family toxin [Paraneptunicella aestuarii]UAA38775.1 type II toxin-antitoxin system HipA family toxin [Paraneptunicella aestuarii]
MKKLLAYMNNEYVGELIKLSNGAHQFTYSEQWLLSPRSRPVSLSLPLRKNTYTSDKVINYFDNLLPDSPLIRQRVVARYEAESAQPFDLLEKIGRDSVGALTLLPEGTSFQNNTLNYEELNDAHLARILSAYKAQAPLGMLKEDQDFRISIAGAQEKTALLKVNGKWCLPKGNTATTHIIKLPIGEIKQPDATLDMSDSVENEYFCIKLAGALGFSVPNVEIVRVGNIKALAVERFDRRWNKNKDWILRLPQEDICQVQGKPSAIKYESEGGAGITDVMDILMGSKNALQDRETFMRFQVFQWIVGATDGHAKNFSLFIEAGGAYRLTPFYDILSAFPVVGGVGLNIRDLKLAMGLKASKGKKYRIDDIFPRHFLATAKQVGFSQERMQEIMDELADCFEVQAKKVLSELPDNFPIAIADNIVEHSLKQVKRLQRK